MSRKWWTGSPWILLAIGFANGCSSGGGGGGGGAAALPVLEGEWELVFAEIGNDCGLPLGSGTEPATIRQHGDVIDMEGGSDHFVGFLSGAALELFEATDDSTWSFELTVSPSGDSFSGTMFRMAELGVTICNHEYEVSGTRTAPLALLAAPIALPAEARIRLDTEVQSCPGGGILAETQLFVFMQTGNSVEIAIPGATGIVESFGTLDGDRLRIHIESSDQGDREIRVGDLIVDASGGLDGQIHTVVRTPAGLCGGVERWESIPRIDGLTHSQTNDQGYEEYTLDLDPTVVLVLIPGATFDMGQAGVADPVHEVTLSPYLIAKSEITNAQYQLYCTATATPIPTGPYLNQMPADHFTNPLYADHPVVNVTWFDIAGYCTWAGLELPTEAQWEFAARGTDGRTYPWGNEAPGAGGTNRANHCPGGFPNCAGDGWQFTSPVWALPFGSFAGPFGTLGQAGNVSEWCRDWYGAYSSGPVIDPTGAPTGTGRVMRGGSWVDGANSLQSASRSFGGINPSLKDTTLGFRPAQAIPPPLPALSFSGTNAEGHEEYTLDLDPTVVLIKIPGGSFDMGQVGVAEPVHPVTLTRDYLISKYEITNAQYKFFCDQTGYPVPPTNFCCGMPSDHFTNPLYADHPVVMVSWDDLDAPGGYLAWAGLALPTEAQWEYAARGTDARSYPWGNEVPDAGGMYRANGCWGNICPGTDAYEYTSPVDAFSGFAGPFGTVGQTGNVWEWCFDWSAPYPSGSVTDPIGPPAGSNRGIRGGSWAEEAFLLQSAVRADEHPWGRYEHLGFRPARELP